MGKEINVADMFSEDGQKQYVSDSMAVGAGIGDLWAVIGKLLSNGLITDAMTLLDMWTTDGKYTFAQVKGAVREALKKLGINLFNGEPVAPRLRLEESDAALTRGAPKTATDVMNHLIGKGVNTKFLPPAMLWMLIELGIKFGLPFIEKLIEKILVKQNVTTSMTFLDLA